MKTLQKQTIGENLLYFMVWASIFLIPVMNSKMMSEPSVSLGKVLMAWRQISPFFFVFIVHNVFIAPRFMERRRHFLYLLANVVLVFAVFSGVEIYERHLAERYLDSGTVEGLDAYRRASFTTLGFYWNILLGIFMNGANIGIKLIYQSMRDEQQMEALKRQNLQAEMDYLKYQINPHFFMNTLNNIHALIDIDTASAQKAVIELSKMMRYVLYDSGREQTPLRQDIQFLKNYIELMKIRYADTVEVRMRYPEQLDERVMIPPLLPIVFVENAFKHGVSYNNPSYIDICIAREGDGIVIRVVNSRHRNYAVDRGGIGLENVRKRLDLIYGDKGYTLDIRAGEEDYSVTLKLPALHA